MQSLASRIAALEVSARLLEKKVMAPKPALSLEAIRKKVAETLARPRPERTQEEVAADFKANLARMDADWRLRYEHA